MRCLFVLLAGFLFTITACKEKKVDPPPPTPEPEIVESLTFEEVGLIDLGEEGAAEISTYDKDTKKLFVVVNEKDAGNRIAVVDLTNPAAPVKKTEISVASYGGSVNSLSVKNGLLAAAIEATDKVSPGKVVVFNTTTHAEIKAITVGALPDMVTFSPDGKYILSANEGEPSEDYTVDPEGSVSIINVSENYATTTLSFASFESQLAALTLKGVRIFGLNATFAKDVEPEYIAISENSTTAWVTLQENNAIAQIDIPSKSIKNIWPLGTKDFNASGNSIDPSDKDGGVNFANWPIKGLFLPDAIATLQSNGIPYIFTANEGDVREWKGQFSKEVSRVSGITLDSVAFPNAADLKKDTKLGRLNVTTTMGDKDKDGDFDELFSFNARSFSVWNGNTGELVFDSKGELDKVANENGKYDDGRSDDKGTEPEGITIGTVNKKSLLFVGLERADGVVIYDATIPTAPVKLQWLSVGDAPEGVLFVPAKESPTKKSLLIVSSEGDGVVKIFTTKAL